MIDLDTLARNLSAALQGRSAGTALVLGFALWRPDDETLTIGSVSAEGRTLILRFSSAPLREPLQIVEPRSVTCSPTGLRVRGGDRLEWGAAAQVRYGQGGAVQVELQGQTHVAAATDYLLLLEPAQGEPA